MRIEWNPEEKDSNISNLNDSSGDMKSDSMESSDNFENQDDFMKPVTDNSSGREKAIHPMEGMTFSQKVKYLFRYYGLKVGAIIVVCGVLIALVVNYITYTEASVRLILMNHRVDDDATQELLESTFDEYLKENGYTDKDYIEVNSEISYHTTDTSTDYLDVQSLMALVATKKYSGFFADETMFTYYASSEYYRNLNLLLTEEQLTELEEQDRIIYGRTYGDYELYPCGIRLNKENCEWLQNTNYEECIFGVLFGEMSDEEAFNLTQYILNYTN